MRGVKTKSRNDMREAKLAMKRIESYMRAGQWEQVVEESDYASGLLGNIRTYVEEAEGTFGLSESEIEAMRREEVTK